MKKKKEVGQENDSQIVLRSLKTASFNLEIVGIQPLISNRISEQTQKQIEDKRSRKGTKVRIKMAKLLPQERFEASMHKTIDGKYGYPAIGFKQSFIAAGRYLDSMSMEYLKGSIHVLGDILPLKYKEIRMRCDHTKKDPATYRAEFVGWSCILPISYNRDLISPEQIAQIFEYAGFHIGVGAWRPARSGQFGTYRVKRTKYFNAMYSVVL